MGYGGHRHLWENTNALVMNLNALDAIMLEQTFLKISRLSVPPAYKSFQDMYWLLTIPSSTTAFEFYPQNKKFQNYCYLIQSGTLLLLYSTRSCTWFYAGLALFIRGKGKAATFETLLSNIESRIRYGTCLNRTCTDTNTSRFSNSSGNETNHCTTVEEWISAPCGSGPPNALPTATTPFSTYRINDKPAEMWLRNFLRAMVLSRMKPMITNPLFNWSMSSFQTQSVPQN